MNRPDRSPAIRPFSKSMLTAMKLRLQFILLIICIPTLIAAQRTLSGIVKEKSSGESLPYASVQIKESQLGTTTNQDGYFTLQNVSDGDVTLVIRYIGYNPLEVEIDKGIGFITVELSNNSQSLTEVLVSAESKAMMKAAENISQISISPKNISALPGIGEKDIFRSMQLLPGVSGSNESSSGLYVRGGTPDQNLVLFDDFTVYHVDHFYGFFSAFNSNAIKDVQLYKGGYEARFGGRTSSVVELTGKTGNENTLKGGLSLGSISANAYTEIPLWSKGSLLLAYRRSLTDVIKTSLYNDIFDLNGKTTAAERLEDAGLSKYVNEPEFQFYDLNTKLTLKPGDKDVLSVSFYNGEDNLDNSRLNENSNSQYSFNFLNDINDLTNWGNTGISVRWGRQWNPRLHSKLVASYSDYFSNRNRYSNSEITKEDGEVITKHIGSKEDNNVLDYTLKNDYQYSLNESHLLDFGLQLTMNDIHYLYRLNDSIDIVNRMDDGVIASFYIQDKYKIQSNLSLTGGIRASYYDNTDKLYLEPRLQLQYQPADRWTLRAAYGLYHQFTKRVIREDVMQGSRDFWVMTDDDLIPVESARHYIIGSSFETKDWLLSAEAYYKQLKGLSEYAPRITTSEDEETQPFFEGTGNVKGLELLVQRKFGDFTGWVSYTLSQIANSFPDISESDYPASHDTPHELKLVGSYNIGKFTFAGTWVYASGKPYTKPIGAYTLTMLDGSVIDYVAVGHKNGSRLPAYHRLDLSGNYTFHLGKLNCELGLSLFNLYNRRNVWYKEFEKVDDAFIETDVNFIGFTPNFFLTMNF